MFKRRMKQAAGSLLVVMLLQLLLLIVVFTVVGIAPFIGQQVTDPFEVYTDLCAILFNLVLVALAVIIVGQQSGPDEDTSWIGRVVTTTAPLLPRDAKNVSEKVPAGAKCVVMLQNDDGSYRLRFREGPYAIYMDAAEDLFKPYHLAE